MDLKLRVDVMLSKLLTVVIVILATGSNFLVSAGARCNSDQYLSSSTAQCENCGSICIDINKRSKECMAKCPDYMPVQDEVNDDNPPAAAVLPSSSLQITIGVVVTAAFSIAVLTVAALFYRKRRAASRSYYISPGDVELQVLHVPDPQESAEITVVSPTDDDAHSALHIGQHEHHPLIPTICNSITAHSIVYQLSRPL